MAEPTGRVVVGVGDSVASLQALRYAVAEARRRRARLVAVRSWQLPSSWTGAHAVWWGHELAGEARVALHAAFHAALGGLPTDVRAQMLVVRDAPGPALVASADRPTDLLVIGGSTRGRGLAPARTSAAWYCARHGRCPLVVVPPPDLARTSTRQLVRALRREAEQLLDRSPGGSRPGRV
jgi:nucleotide-binding universal stress UspA family protein